MADPIVTNDINLTLDVELGITNTVSPPPDYGSSVSPPYVVDDAPPPSYNETAKDAPPSYQDIFGQMQDAKKNSSSSMDFIVKLIKILLNTIVMTIFLAVVLAIPIAMIVMGALYKDDCPIEPKIPIYMIVTGCFYILKSLIDLVVRCQHREVEGETPEEARNRKENALSRLIGCFLLGFFIAGNVWIYSNYPPDDDPSSPNYCYGPLYYFAFWMITSAYILIALMCLCVCCVAGVTTASVATASVAE